MSQNDFVSLPRQQFRRYFQPSRILLGVIPAPTESGVNVITLCFGMYCSYDPPMISVAIHDVNQSYRLIKEAPEYVLAVPGPTMLQETVFCGTKSLANVDKVKALSIALVPSEAISTPGLAKAIANIELTKEATLDTGDHIVVVGRVLRFGVNRTKKELPLLSIGPELTGYRLLAHEGVHRIATVIAG